MAPNTPNNPILRPSVVDWQQRQPSSQPSHTPQPGQHLPGEGLPAETQGPKQKKSRSNGTATDRNRSTARKRKGNETPSSSTIRPPGVPPATSPTASAGPSGSTSSFRARSYVHDPSATGVASSSYTRTRARSDVGPAGPPNPPAVATSPQPRDHYLRAAYDKQRDNAPARRERSSAPNAVSQNTHMQLIVIGNLADRGEILDVNVPIKRKEGMMFASALHIGEALQRSMGCIKRRASVFCDDDGFQRRIMNVTDKDKCDYLHDIDIKIPENYRLDLHVIPPAIRREKPQSQPEQIPPPQMILPPPLPPQFAIAGPQPMVPFPMSYPNGYLSDGSNYSAYTSIPQKRQRADSLESAQSSLESDRPDSAGSYGADSNHGYGTDSAGSYQSDIQSVPSAWDPSLAATFENANAERQALLSMSSTSQTLHISGSQALPQQMPTGSIQETSSEPLFTPKLPAISAPPSFPAFEPHITPVQQMSSTSPALTAFQPPPPLPSYSVEISEGNLRTDRPVSAPAIAPSGPAFSNPALVPPRNNGLPQLPYQTRGEFALPVSPHGTSSFPEQASPPNERSRPPEPKRMRLETSKYAVSAPNQELRPLLSNARNSPARRSDHPTPSSFRSAFSRLPEKSDTILSAAVPGEFAQAASSQSTLPKKIQPTKTTNTLKIELENDPNWKKFLDKRNENRTINEELGEYSYITSTVIPRYTSTSKSCTRADVLTACNRTLDWAEKCKDILNLALLYACPKASRRNEQAAAMLDQPPDVIPTFMLDKFLSLLRRIHQKWLDQHPEVPR
ncbi:hypothetical protein A0H81_12879 [Grifola frondosa]|uniref:Uncharacterized protein n=1 Tax=Grifola frondosa TaxID=5627 RepID=A0A1C7LTH7_GRIFR|nr:hypothetical protein A0H81_12879 [Grifola frondosa]